MEERPPPAESGDIEAPGPGQLSDRGKTVTRRVTTPPLPEPAPPSLTEEFPEERSAKVSCLTALGAVLVIFVGVLAIMLVASSFLSSESRPFGEGGEVTSTFLNAATAGDKSGMRDQLSAQEQRAMGDEALGQIATYMQDRVGDLRRLDRTEEEISLDPDGAERIHLAFVIHGTKGTALIDVDLAREGGLLKITHLALR